VIAAGVATQLRFKHALEAGTMKASSSNSAGIKWVSLPFTLLGALILPISASHANTITYIASLSGPAESPPNASPGTGMATVTTDDVAHTLFVDVTFSGLLGTTTASHIHCCTAAPGTGTAMVATTIPTFAGSFGVGLPRGPILTLSI
jgi:hypothetical protein